MAIANVYDCFLFKRHRCFYNRSAIVLAPQTNDVNELFSSCWNVEWAEVCILPSQMDCYHYAADCIKLLTALKSSWASEK